MSLSAINFLAFDAVSGAFRKWICRYSVKELMARFDCAEATAKKWRMGKLPENRHQVAMVEAWGEEFLLFIFAPVLRQSDLSLDRQISAIENRLALIRESLTDETHPGTPRRAADRMDGPSADRLGGAHGEAGAGLARRGTKAAARAVALGLMLAASLHGPLADVLGDGVFGARIARTVRVKAGGRNEFSLGGGVA